MKCPKHLKHRPIIVVDDYEKIDACGSNDAKALSIGKAHSKHLVDDYINANKSMFLDKIDNIRRLL